MMKFDRENFQIGFFFSPLEWKFGAEYMGCYLIMDLGPLNIQIGNPIHDIWPGDLK
jgi:hypothetical protein